MARCKAVALVIEHDEDGAFKSRSRCTRDDGHDGQHYGEWALQPRPRFDRDHEIIDSPTPLF